MLYKVSDHVRVEVLGNEFLLYDGARGLVHRVSMVGAPWVRDLMSGSAVDVDESVVIELLDAGLLEPLQRVGWSGSRRRMLVVATSATAVGLTTLLLPSAAAAESCAKPLATGGTVTDVGGYRIHTFTTVGTSDFVVSQGGCVEYLVIAGGAGGSDGGGGGAGGYRSNVPGQPSGGGASAEPVLVVVPQTYVVTVGAGGKEPLAGPGQLDAWNGGPLAVNGIGTNGENSSFSTITSIGGGTGGLFYTNGYAGGSGGGAGGNNGSNPIGGAGTAGQGYAGGNGFPGGGGAFPGGGGGGAGGPGGNPPDNLTGGAGGAGASSTITGSAVVRAGGGGGIAVIDGGAVGGAAGSGGGGKGAAANFSGDPSDLSTPGEPNTGGGGGGGSPEETAGLGYGKPGGSGIVIIRYPL